MALNSAGTRGVSMVACLVVIIMLGGCGTTRTEAKTTASPPAPGVDQDVLTRGSPVPPAAAEVLSRTPAGGRFDYLAGDQRRTAFILGTEFQSGLQVPCRLGRVDPILGDGPTTYAFCRKGDRWYAMPPVVVSGY